MTSEMTAPKFYLFIFNLENVAATLGDSLPGTSDELTLSTIRAPL